MKSSDFSGGLIAQSAEHRPFKAVVPGSSPGQPTIFLPDRFMIRPRRTASAAVGKRFFLEKIVFRLAITRKTVIL